MHIQLVGVPASGKTTISKELIKLYPSQYCEAEKRFGSFSKFIWSNPVLAFKVVVKCLPIIPLCVQMVAVSKVSLKNKFIAIAGLMLNLANYLAYIKKGPKPNKVVVWDELLLQRGLSILAYNTTLAKHKKILKYVTWAFRNCDAIPIFIFCEEKKQLERFERRGAPKRMERYTHTEVKEILRIQTQTLTKMLEYSTPQFQFNSGQDIKQDAIDLHSKLKFLDAS